jgi:hypothetical protein
MGHLVHFGVSGTQNVDALFFMLRWARYGFDEKPIGTRYAKFVYLHPLGSAGHVVYSGVSGASNVDALFSCSGELDVVSIKITPGHVTSNPCFCIWWDLWVT